MMARSVTANQLGGRAIGSLFFTVFGALWLLLALYARESLRMGTVVPVVVGALALVSGAFWLLRKAKSFPRVPNDPAVGKQFNRINILQWVAIAIVAFACNKLHLDAYVISAITAIVGLHMFPLAKLFRYPLHSLTGAVLVAWASVSCVSVPLEQLQSTTAIGTGSILWVSAATTLTMAALLARKSQKQGEASAQTAVAKN